MAKVDLGYAALYDTWFNLLAEDQAKKVSEADTDHNAAQAILGSLHKAQLALLEDPARRKAALCPRRSGKSWAAMSYAHTTCLTRPGARVVIVTLTLKTAKNIYWWEMQEFARHYGLSLDYFANELRVDFPNGSKIMLIGAESKAQVDKLRGSKYDLIIIDECKSFPSMVMKELINDVIQPALSDRLGTLLLIGTPGSILDGMFYEATFPGLADDEGIPFSRTYLRPEPHWSKSKETPRWSRHTWTQLDNKFIPHLTQDALETKRMNGWDGDNPTWLREYLGHWVPSDSAFVYAFAKLYRDNPATVIWKPEENGKLFGLPKDKTWHFLLGLDLGFEDDTAMVIAAYNEEEPTLYQVWEYKEPHKDVDQVGRLIQQCFEMVPGGFDAVVGDFGGGGKQIIETFIRRYGVKIIPAEKRDKFDYIELMNTDYYSGRIKLLKGSDLSLEKQVLQWDLSKGGKEHLARTGKLKEHDALPNHLCDAWLYIWRYSYHFFAKRAEQGPMYGTSEWEKAELERIVGVLTRERVNPDKGYSNNEDVAREIHEYCRFN
jgi:hypothetical protein